MTKTAKLALLALGLLSLAFQSCQTVSGAGQDLQSAGQAIQNSANR